MIKKISISMDDKLLEKLNNYADANYITRSGLISIAVHEYMLQKEALYTLKKLSSTMERIAESNSIDEQSKKELEGFTTFANLLYKNR